MDSLCAWLEGEKTWCEGFFWEFMACKGNEKYRKKMDACESGVNEKSLVSLIMVCASKMNIYEQKKGCHL